MSKSHSLLGFFYLTSVVWIKVLEIGLKMTFALIFLYIEACWLGSAPSDT